MKKWIPHVTVAAVVKTNVDGQQKYLMVEETINNNLVINQAAGHWENNESIIDAVKRETLEETSYIVEPSFLVGIYNWTIPQNENARPSIDTFLRFTFYCDLVNKTDSPLDPDINQFLWLNEQEIRSEKYPKRNPLVLQSLDDYLAGKNFPLNQFIDIK